MPSHPNITLSYENTSHTAMSSVNPILLTILSAVACHWFFRTYEPRNHTLFKSIVAFIIVPPSIFAFVFRNFYGGRSCSALLLSHTLYIISLFSSIVLYRLSPFHPLAGIPGPTIGKISRFWSLYIASTGQQLAYIQELHSKYGPVVRTGPNHLHIVDASAVPVVLGAKHFEKAERYQVVVPVSGFGALGTMVNFHDHQTRRKLWDRAMNPEAMQGYRDIFSKRINQFVALLEKQNGQIIDLSLYSSLLAFDVMGDLAFNGRFEMMQATKDQNDHISTTRGSAYFFECSGKIPWIRPLVPYLMRLNSRALAFHQLAVECITKRINEGSKNKDLFYHLFDEENGKTWSFPMALAESRGTILAGSDTTGTAITSTLFHLMTNPSTMTKLRNEIDMLYNEIGDIYNSSDILAKLPYLNAVINEGLRLAPALPSGSPRYLPHGKGAVILSDTTIPEGTTVQIPTFVLHRDPRYFSPQPNSFIPERWLDEKLRPERMAYIPFSAGPTSCAGKNFAMTKLRLLLCILIHTFNFEIPPTFDPKGWEGTLKDNFILTKGELPVCVTIRSPVSVYV